MILKLHGNETRSSCDEVIFFSLALRSSLTRLRRKPSVSIRKKYPLEPRIVAARLKKLKMKEIGKLVGNLLCLDKQAGISERGQTFVTFYAWNECTQSSKLKFLVIKD